MKSAYAAFEAELNAIREDTGNIRKLIDLMRQDNPDLVTDMRRDFSYIVF